MSFLFILLVGVAKITIFQDLRMRTVGQHTQTHVGPDR